MSDAEMKIGVYFCTCGTIIAEKIDPEKVAKEVCTLPGVAYCKSCDYLCSEEGKAFLQQDLKDEKPDRVVISACSPRDYERTFRECMGAADINPYLMQMVNVREQVAWVTADPEQAVQKTVHYIRGAARRVSLQVPLEEKEIEVCSDVLVVGAGPAGLKAAMALADSGRKVILVEKTPVLGGLPQRYEELFPNLECAPCMLEPLQADIFQSKNIEILTLSEVAEVVGYCGNFTVKIRHAPRYVDAVRCIGCGECVNPCPVSTPNEFNCGLDQRKAMAFALKGGLPNAPFIDMKACLRGKGEDCTICRTACPVEATVLFDDQEKIHARNVGAIILAVGASLYDCSVFPNLAYGTAGDVYTSLEFERLLSASGPTSGQLLTRAGTPPRSVAILHCVGSLDEHHTSYCSGVCCQYAFKFNQLVHHKLPEAKIFHFYRELVTPGKEECGLFARAMAHPHAQFIRYGNLAELKVEAANGANHLRYSDAGAEREVEADMVVLCPAIVPSESSKRLAALVDTNLDKFGFFEELHGRGDAGQSKIKGIFLAGTCQSPKDVQGSMNQGMAAAGYVLSQLATGKKLKIDPVTAQVREDACSGCQVCRGVCPYKAIAFDLDQQVSVVNALLCHGCGTCVAACPSGAMEGNHFTVAQISAEIEGILQ
jgi:heterodisulfide reductase subunit A2